MDERESRRRENDSLQSGERDPAYGQDARDFGVGGQTIERALDQGDDDAPDRKLGRDESLPPRQRDSGSKS